MTFKNILTILFAVSLILGGSLVSAQEEDTVVSPNPTADTIEEIVLDENVSAEDLGIAEPSLLPDNPFYVFKEIGRGIQSFFTFDQTKKLELKEKFSNEKLIEVKKMVEANKNRERVETALQNYQKELGEMQQIATRIQERTQTEANEETGKFLDKFIQQQTVHQRVLQSLENQVSEETVARIQAVREEHLENFSQVMTKLENANAEKIQERLEKNLQEVKGSEFKGFKDLEILQRLEEKASEEVKSAIQNVQKNTLNNLKEKLETLPAQERERFQNYIENVSGDKEKQLEILKTIEQAVPAVRNIISNSSEKILEQVRERIQQTESKTDSQGACTTQWDPVCGKDGKTYSNKCFAGLAGTEVAGEGICGEQKREQEQEMNTIRNENQSGAVDDQETGNFLQKKTIEPVKGLLKPANSAATDSAK